MNQPKKRSRIWTSRRVVAGGERLRVLVVDDNALAADAMAMYLSFEDFEMETAYGGRQAVRIALNWAPHLIVMDISMPDISGFDAAMQIRNDTRASHTAMIAFTALDETEVQRHLIDHEFDAYCQKGQPPSELLALVNHFAM